MTSPQGIPPRKFSQHFHLVNTLHSTHLGTSASSWDLPEPSLPQHANGTVHAPVRTSTDRSSCGNLHWTHPVDRSAL